MNARRGARGLFTFPTLVGMLAMACASAAFAQDNLEYAVKANYLVRFAAFVDWPPQAFSDPGSPVVVCVAGRDPFGAAIDRAVVGQTAHGRALVVRRLGDSDAAVAGCSIAYLGEGAGSAATALSAQPMTLTVTDQEVAGRRGVIHFVIAQGRVRFHVNRTAAQRSGVTIGSRLLNLALSVRG